MSTIVNDLVSHLQCGEAISANDAVYISSVDGKIYKYSPLDPLQVYAGIAKEAGLLNAFIRVVQSGRVKGFSGLTPGQFVYASITVPGSFQLTDPGGSLKVVLGVAKSATELTVNGALGIKTGGDGTGVGGINYITNSMADSLIGWATYADAAGTSPVDGTGGSPTVTLTRSTSNPLRGDANFLYTKPASNVQGQGFSYDFTIDRADRNKVLQISFDYQIASGTYADNDMTVWIYDVTNATLIQPAPYQLKNVIGSEKMGAEFQTSSSLNYRLIVHTSSTSASAYSIQFDNFIVGPQAKLYGSPITDWVPFTPTGSWIANTTYTGRYRRVGDNAEFEVNLLLSGSPTATPLLLNIPFGWTVDTTKTSNNGSCGRGFAVDTGNFSYSIRVANSLTNQVSISVANTAAAFPQMNPVTSTAPFTFGSTDYISVRFSVPILGWGSSTLMSNDANTRVVDFIGYVGVNQALTANTTNITLVSEKDSHGTWAGSSYTIPVGGDYLITTGISSTAAVTVGIEAYVNGILTARVGIINSGQTSVGAVTLPNLRAGDVIAFRSSGAMTTAAGNTLKMSISKISGPAQIAASETVSCRYYTNAGQSLVSATDTLINFSTKDWDSHNAVTTGASWIFTAPMSGIYSVKGVLRTASVSYTSGQRLIIKLYKSGAYNQAMAVSDTGQATVSIARGGAFGGEVKLLAGESIRIYADSSVAANLDTINEFNWVSIDRVGNY